LAWRIEFTPESSRAIRKLGRPDQHRIVAYLEALLVDCENPRQRGKGLTAQFSGFWRYRIGDYRVICKLKDEELIVIVVALGHRSSVYQ
jgi:mRNA interferase RelE/StbE